MRKNTLGFYFAGKMCNMLTLQSYFAHRSKFSQAQTTPSSAIPARHQFSPLTASRQVRPALTGSPRNHVSPARDQIFQPLHKKVVLFSSLLPPFTIVLICSNKSYMYVYMHMQDLQLNPHRFIAMFINIPVFTGYTRTCVYYTPTFFSCAYIAHF